MTEELNLTPEDEVGHASIKRRLATFYPYQMCGKVSQVVGLVIEGKGPVSSVGDAALIYSTEGKPPINAEIVGFKEGKTLLMPLGELRGIGGTDRRSLGNFVPAAVASRQLLQIRHLLIEDAQDTPRAFRAFGRTTIEVNIVTRLQSRTPRLRHYQIVSFSDADMISIMSRRTE